MLQVTYWRELGRLTGRLDRLRLTCMRLDGVPRPSVLRDRVEVQLITLERAIAAMASRLTVELLTRDITRKRGGRPDGRTPSETASLEADYRQPGETAAAPGRTGTDCRLAGQATAQSRGECGMGSPGAAARERTAVDDGRQLDADGCGAGVGSDHATP